MATEVDTRAAAPQANGECTNAIFNVTYVGAKSAGAAAGPAGVALPGPLSLHGMGCSAGHASPCVPFNIRNAPTAPQQQSLHIIQTHSKR